MEKFYPRRKAWCLGTKRSPKRLCASHPLLWLSCGLAGSTGIISPCQIFLVKGTDFPRDKYTRLRAHKECCNKSCFRCLWIAQILPTRTPAFCQAVHPCCCKGLRRRRLSDVRCTYTWNRAFCSLLSAGGPKHRSLGVIPENWCIGERGGRSAPEESSNTCFQDLSVCKSGHLQRRVCARKRPGGCLRWWPCRS